LIDPPSGPRLVQLIAALLGACVIATMNTAIAQTNNLLTRGALLLRDVFIFFSLSVKNSCAARVEKRADLLIRIFA